MGKKIILLTSNEPWGDMWFSKQHYANELAKLGHTVYFVNPVSKWSISKLFSFKLGVEKIKENLFLVNYDNQLPLLGGLLFMVYLNDWINCLKLKKGIGLKKTDNIIWWKFDLFRFVKTSFFKAAFKIYHVVDPYIHIKTDKPQAQNADLIVCTSKAYVKEYEAYKKPIKVIPHGVSKDEFNVDNQKVKSILSQHGAFAVLVGSVSKYVSFDLLHTLADNGIKLLLIGKVYALPEKEANNWEALKNRELVSYVGVVNGKELKNYIAASSVALIAYNFDMKKSIGKGNPIKEINYIAQQKCIITSIPTQIKELDSNGIYYAQNSDEFVERLKSALKGSLLVNEKEYSNYIKSILYPNLIKNILDE